MSPSFAPRLLPALVVLVALATGLAMSFLVYRAEDSALESRFAVVADDAADRVRERVDRYVTFLKVAHAFVSAQQSEISRRSFATFVSRLDLAPRFAGIRGLGFARLIDKGGESRAEAEIAASYGGKRAVWPAQTDQAVRTPIVLLEPLDARNQAALGYDMYTDPIRRAGMVGALIVDGPFASGPVLLVQETAEDEQIGFLVYIPFRRPGGDKVEGFLYAPFRAGDLHTDALLRAPPLPVAVRTDDVASDGTSLLYRSPDFDTVAAASAFRMERSFEVAGREWRMTIVSTPAFGDRRPSFGVMLLATVTLLLAVALAASAQAQIRAVDAARLLNEAAEKSVQDKDMLLQEMKHRIKNSIARVLAIARQTAMHSASIEAFSDSYTARLQAMASAQDLLTRSHGQRADLRELLSTEIEQVFGAAARACTLTGESIELDERATQALGLVFHELATNALKYGGIAGNAGALDVRWSHVPVADTPALEIVWTEHSDTPIPEPAGSGFGTRLIDANICAELNGTIARDFRPSGLRVRMTIPVESCA